LSRFIGFIVPSRISGGVGFPTSPNQIDAS
jgi:hypothetical protein